MSVINKFINQQIKSLTYSQFFNDIILKVSKQQIYYIKLYYTKLSKTSSQILIIWSTYKELEPLLASDKTIKYRCSIIIS